MKKLPILILILLLNKSIYSQDSVKLDTIFRLNQEIIPCKITSVTEKEVIYSFPNESLTNTLSKNQIQEIHLASGRVQKVSEIVEINGEKDWEKVIITNIESDILGLVKKGEVRGKANAFTTLSTVDDMKNKAEMKIKMQAAALGAHIVFIKTYDSQQVHYGMSTAKANISGVAYGYK